MSNSMMNKFDVMEKMVREAVSGNCRSLIVSGPAGVGKTFTIVKAIKEFQSNIAPLLDMDVQADVCSGTMTPINLYMRLYKNRFRNSVLVLDDMDSVFGNETSLNILKAALDLADDKTLGYYSESHALRRENIPNEFVFEGSVIFISNLDFKNGPKQLQPHFEAVLSRSHYIDLGMRSPSELMAWVVNAINTTSILDGLDDEARHELTGYMIDNKDALNEISLRMVKKLASLSRMGSGWQDIANVTCLTD